MRDQDEERRPAHHPDGVKIPGSKIVASVPRDNDIRQRSRRHDYALLVTYERADGRVCNQLYTNLPAAERRVARVKERGLQAVLTAVQILPLASTVLPGETWWGE